MVGHQTSAAKMLEDQRKMMDLVTGRSSAMDALTKAVQGNSKPFDVATGRTSAAASISRALKDQRKMMDLVTGRSSAVASISKALEINPQLFGYVTGRESAVASISKALERNPKMYDFVTGRASTVDALTKAVRGNSKLFELATGQPYVQMFNASTTLRRLVTSPDFASMVGVGRPPRAAWADVLAALESNIGADLHEGVAAEFDAAADLSDEVDGDGWWVARLPLAAQGVLLVQCPGFSW